MNVLILGGTGLISTAITKQLLKRGDSVTHYNRGVTPARFEGEVRVINGNRYDRPAFEEQMKNEGPWDVVIDMICYHPEDAKALGRVVKGKTKQVIFCSTVDVYGKPATELPYTEDEPLGGVTDYAKNKIVCEELIAEDGKEGRYQTTIIRPACTYGEGGNIIHTFGWESWYLDRLRQGLPVIQFGDGTSVWVWCHVDDCATAFTGACLNEKAFGNAYHATSDELLTWNRSHEIICEAMGWPAPKLIYIPIDLLYEAAPEASSISKFNFAHNNFYDNSKAKNDLGFTCSVPFSEGCKRTIEHLQKINAIKGAETNHLTDDLIGKWNKAKAIFLED